MRAIGRGIALTVLVGCAALAVVPRAVAETQDEQPIAVPELESAPAPTEIAAATTKPLAVRDVRVENTDGGRQVVIALTRAPEGVQDFQLTAPPRLVVDVRGPLGRRGGEQRFAVGDAAVSRVRVAPYEGQLRIVLDLGAKAAVGSVRQEGATLVAELTGSTSSSKIAAAPAAPPTPSPTAVASSAPRASDAVLAAIVDTPPLPAAMPEPEPAVDPAPTSIAAVDAEPEARPRRPEPAIRSRFREIPADGPTIEPIAYAPTAEGSASTARLAPVRKDTLGPAPAEPVYTGQKISLDFKDADIQNVLRVLADVSGLNIIATDDVQGKVTLHLSDVPWDQAFDLVLRTNRLEKTQEGNVVRVSSVKRLTEERDALKAANDSENQLEPLQVKYIRVNYARADEVLVDKVKAVLSERGAVTFDDRTNTIIVRDIDRGIADASHLIRELDVQSPQVLIEANIVEASQDFARGLGIQWGYKYNAGPSTGNPTGMNFPGTVGLGGSGVGVGSAPPPSGTGALPTGVPFLASFPIPDSFGSGFGAGSGSALDLALGSLDGAHSLTARITALENDGKAKVISRPRVITMNNVAATIQSLTIIRVKLPSTGTIISTGGGGASGGNTATEKINTGITLVVTPQVSSDGFVLMNIYAKSSLPDFTRAVDGIPSEVSREANSNVLVRNGDTVVLGGIYRHTSDDREDGLPYLSKVPAIGWMFKRTLESKHHEELLVFLTPKVVETGTAALPPAEQLWQERRGG
jgi:type IV pilus secretin PilQ/predicted competence protein